MFGIMYRKFTLKDLAIIVVSLAVALPITLVLFILYYLFCYLQEEAFLSSGDYLLLQNGYIELSFILFGLVLFVLILTKMDFSDYTNKYIEIYKRFNIYFVIILTFLIFFIVMSYQFFAYSIFSPDGIFYKATPFNIGVHYNWNDVKKVNVYYTISPREHVEHYDLHYVLEMGDNVKFDLKNSKQFWSGILAVDSIIRKNKVKVDRERTDKNIYSNLIRDDETIKSPECFYILKEIITVK